MKLKNTSEKTIIVSNSIILPGETAIVDDSCLDSAPVQRLVKMGALKPLTAKTVAPAQKPEPESEQEDEAPAEDNADEQEDEAPAKDIAKMTKPELVEECHRLGIEVADEDTKAVLIEKINAMTDEGGEKE